MTNENNKNLTIAEQLKTQLNTPKTQEVRYVEAEDLYPDLGYEDINSGKGYGPCSTCGVSDKKFRLVINLRNAGGGHIQKTVHDIDSAADEAGDIISGTNGWEGTASTGVFRAKNRNNLVDKINKAIDEHSADGGKVISRAVTNDVEKKDN